MSTDQTDHHRQQKSDRYAGLSRRKLQQAQQELNRGDTMQASEKAYGAVTSAAKAYGELRGWNHYNHHRVGLILEQLRDEENNPALTEAYDAIRGLHSNFFEYELSTTNVQDRIGTAQRLVAALESLRQSDPKPLPANSLTRDQRRRLTLLMQPPQEEPTPIDDLPSLDDLPPVEPVEPE